MFISRLTGSGNALDTREVRAAEMRTYKIERILGVVKSLVRSAKATDQLFEEMGSCQMRHLYTMEDARRRPNWSKGSDVSQQSTTPP